MIPLDPYHLAPNGIPFAIAGAPSKFYDGNSAEQMQRYFEHVPYSHERAFGTDRDYYLLQIKELREITIMDEVVDNRVEGGRIQQIPMNYSILQAEILSVFHNNLGLKEGDVVMLASSCVRNKKAYILPN